MYYCFEESMLFFQQYLVMAKNVCTFEKIGCYTMVKKDFVKVFNISSKSGIPAF